MQNSKLAALLGSLSPQEWKSFLDLVASPYFNRNPDLVRMAAWLHQSGRLRENPTREQLWQALYPGQPADQRQLNYLMSWLLKLGEQFLGLEHYQQQVFEPEWQTAEALLSRGLFKHYRFNAERLRRRLSASPLRNTAYLLQEYRFADLELRANSSQEISRQTDEHLQQASDQLDYFYLTEKLKYACTMLNNQNVVSSSYEFQFVEEVRRFVENHAFPATAPGIALYFRVYQMLVKENGDADFQALRQLLPLQKDRFSQEEMAWLYSYALNYCIRQIRHVREEFVAEALQLYEEGVESGVLLTDNGQLSPWHYKNIVKLGLRLQRFAWTEGFIREKNLLLAQESRADALHFNLADLFFYTGRYAEAQQHLNQLEFSDVHYNLDAKEMLAKIYYETEAFDALDSLLHAFKSYLQRNRIITENVRKAYLNFIKWLRLLLRTTPDKYAALRLRIEKSDQVTAKNWLLEQTKSGKNQATS